VFVTGRIGEHKASRIARRVIFSEGLIISDQGSG
jgi:hypothetical protein